jgi:hypothetical protein
VPQSASILCRAGRHLDACIGASKCRWSVKRLFTLLIGCLRSGRGQPRTRRTASQCRLQRRSSRLPHKFPHQSLLRETSRLREFLLSFSLSDFSIHRNCNRLNQPCAATTWIDCRCLSVVLTAVLPPSAVSRWVCDHRNAATRAACSAITRALLSSAVPAASPLINTVGLDHTAMASRQPPRRRHNDLRRHGPYPR